MKTKSKWTRILLTGASLAAMGAFSPALAQDDEVSDEIVVTATGRTAALQDVPVAVTAIAGDQIENTGANDLRDLTQVAPSFSMGTGQSNSSGTTARIRGVGTGSDNPGFEAAVGIFIDGVYRARAGAALADLPELERVEILRGPQGTLFGRNTSAGAISVVTAGPDFAPGMSLEGTFGVDDLEEIGTRAMVNVPLGDTFAVRLDGSIRARDGFITDLISGNDINTRDRYTLRGQALWDISPDASLRVIVDGSGTNEVCCGVTPLVYGATQPAITAIVGAAGTPAINPEGRGMTVTPALGPLPSLGPGLPAQPANGPRAYSEDTEEMGASAQLDWDIGGMNFTSITASREWDAVRDQDIDFNLIDIAYRDDLEVGFDNFTQEFRLQGESGRLNWLVGLFYGDETLEQRDTIRVGQHSNLYANALARGGTVSLATPLGCELYDSSAVPDPDTIPSFFFCASGANPALANTYLQGNVSGQGQQNDRWQVETESLAVFTHDEFSITDQLILTVGVRYNQETKDLSANLNSVSNSCAALQAVEIGTDPFFGGAADRVGFVQVLQGSPAASGLMNIACNPAINPIANGVWTGDSEENEWSGTLSLAYHMSDDVMLYGGYSRGYKAGGFNVDRSGFSITPDLTPLDLAADPNRLNVGQLAFAPEFTDSYEFGIRSTLFGNTTANLTAFYQEIHDYQLNAFNGFNFITRNIPEAISQGVELEVASRLTDNLTVSGGIVYNEAYYDSTVVFNTLDPTPNTVVAGTPFAFAPELVTTGAIQYEMPLGGDLRALFYLDGRYNDGYRTQTLNRDPLGRTDNEGFAIFNGRIGIGPTSEHWSLELWGRNLTDEFYYVGAFVPPLQSGTFVIYPNEPLTYGVTLRARY
jgi:iron complex outermembrane recepter protein